MPRSTGQQSGHDWGAEDWTAHAPTTLPQRGSAAASPAVWRHGVGWGRIHPQKDYAESLAMPLLRVLRVLRDYVVASARRKHVLVLHDEAGF